MNDTTRPFSSAEALRYGWRTTQANLKPLLIISAIGGFLALLGQALTGPAGQTHPRPLLGLAIQALQAGVTLAFIRVALALHDGRSVDYDRPLELLRGFLPYLLTCVLYGLIVAGGFILLIVPGVIWAIQFGFSTFLVAETNLDPVAALKESSRLTRGVKGHLFVFALMLLGTNLLGALALGIGLLVTIPTTFLAAAYGYRALQARAAATAHLAPHEPPAAFPTAPVHP